MRVVKRSRSAKKCTCVRNRGGVPSNCLEPPEYTGILYRYTIKGLLRQVCVPCHGVLHFLRDRFALLQLIHLAHADLGQAKGELVDELHVIRALQLFAMHQDLVHHATVSIAVPRGLVFVLRVQLAMMRA